MSDFEGELRARYSADRAVLTSSGTHALQLALAGSAGPSPERAPIAALPAFSCFDLVTAAAGASVRVVFYDVDPASLTPDLDSVREALRAGASILVAGNLYGFPLDWDALRTECRAADAVLVEDAAQGLGSGWRGRPSGTFGDLTVLSFGRGKGWSGGGGGALLVRGDVPQRWAPAEGRLEGPARGTAVKAFALSWALWCLGRPSLYRLPASAPGLKLGETVYKEPTAVRSISSANAAIAHRHATATWDAVATRRANAARWRGVTGTGFRQEWALRPCEPLDDGACGYLRYPLLAGSAGERARFLQGASAFGGAGGYPTPLPELEAAAPLAAGDPRPFPGARDLADRLLTLPTHPRVTDRDFEGMSGT
ncbi:MAG: DegT/DnrJ/EryC1/StrS family aminotransferase [Gemmatimonadota bacterium]